MRLNEAEAMILLTWIDNRVKDVGIDELAMTEATLAVKVVLTYPESAKLLFTVNSKNAGLKQIYDWAINLPEHIKRRIKNM